MRKFILTLTLAATMLCATSCGSELTTSVTSQGETTSHSGILLTQSEAAAFNYPMEQLQPVTKDGVTYYYHQTSDKEASLSDYNQKNFCSNEGNLTSSRILGNIPVIQKNHIDERNDVTVTKGLPSCSFVSSRFSFPEKITKTNGTLIDDHTVYFASTDKMTYGYAVTESSPYSMASEQDTIDSLASKISGAMTTKTIAFTKTKNASKYELYKKIDGKFVFDRISSKPKFKITQRKGAKAIYQVKAKSSSGKTLFVQRKSLRIANY